MKTMLLVCLGLATIRISPLDAAQPGQKLWEFQTGGMVWSSPALGTDGTVYVASWDGRLYALDALTAVKKWEFDTGAEITSSPVLSADGRVHIRSFWQLYALDARTGARSWAFARGFNSNASVPAVGPEGTVYVGWSDGKVYALDGTSGAEKWAFGSQTNMFGSPVLGADGTVYVGAGKFGDGVVALDGATGRQKWAFATGGSVSGSPAIGANGTVYVGSENGMVYALDGTTGVRKWAFLTGKSVISSPAIGADETVYIGSQNGEVYALDGATGVRRWAFPTGASVISSPAIAADGTVYCGSFDQKLYALDGVTGTRKWTWTTGGPIRSSPVIGPDGTVYVGSDDGKLYALQGSASLADSPWPKFRQNAQNTGRVEPAPAPPQITEQPVGVRVPVGGDFRLRVSASGTPPLAYQWFHSGQMVSGAVNSVLSVTDAALGHSGDYQVIVNNSAGAMTSQVARVVVGYVLTLTTNGVGTVQAEPTLEVYEPGQTVVLTAMPGVGRTFVGWEGDVSGTGNPLALTMNGSEHVEAVFSTRPGDLKWVVATGGPVHSSPAVGDDGTVYIGPEDRGLYALDGGTGAQKWVFLTGGYVISSPALGTDGTVYVGSQDSKVYALDGATGSQNWVFVARDGVLSSPAVGTDGTVYVGSLDRRVYALDGKTGAQKWDFVTGSGISYSSPALGADGTVYVGSTDSRVYALDGTSGAQKWTVLTSGWVLSSPGLSAESTVYVPTFGEPRVYALDGATGAQRWSVVAGGWSSAAIGADGAVYVGALDYKVYAFDGATGRQKWTYRTANAIISSPALSADGTVYVGSDDGRLYALDTVGGAKKWAFATGDWVRSSPAIGADGTVYVGSGDGSIYALQGSSGLADSPWPKFHQNARNTGRQRVIAPVVLRQPSRVVLKEGGTGKIAVKVSGEPVPALRWFFHGEPIPGATEATLTIPSVTRPDEGIYTLVASNAVGQVTSQPILALVSNVDPLSFVGLRWEGENAGPVSLEATAQLGEMATWHSISNFPPSATPQVYVELDPADAARFYRLNGADRVETLRAAFIPGWWFTQPAGTTHRIEYVSPAAGWTNWQVLTNLTLPSSPHLFLDTAAFDHPGGVYRTAPVQ